MSWIREAYQLQNDYNAIFAEWKTFDRDHTEYIKSMIGLMLFGIRDDVENPPPIVSYYQVYDIKNQKIIDTIYEHVKKCRFRNEIFLSCTYLIGKNRNDEIFTFPVLRYSSSPSGRVYFTEITGRYYQNWDDFISSNQLPPCDFIAPSNGIYTPSTPVYMKYKSPAASPNRKLMATANKVAAVGTLGCVVAGMCAVAPVTILTMGFGLSAFGVGQSISVLRDRKDHGQSIAPDNRESLFSYGNIVANGLSGASFAAVSNLGRLQRLFGNYANAVTTTCKVLNVSTLILDSSFLVINAYDFYTKLRTRTVTHQDVFDLCLQIFLVCGAVVQTREMHKLLKQSQSSSSTSGLVNKKLTRTQKRNLQKRRAKARARGEQLSVVSASSSSDSSNLTPVKENDTFSSLKMFSLKIGAYGVNVMMAIYPRSEVILNYYYDLRESIRNTFTNRTMDVKTFLQQLLCQSRNLYTILRQDIERMKEILRLFIPNPSINNSEMIAQTMNNEMDRINSAAEELMPTAELEVMEENESRDDPRISTDLRELILKFVYETCSKYRIQDTADAQISFFHTILVLTTTYLNDNCVKLFDEAFQRSGKVVGIEKAKKMVTVLGEKFENDFHPTLVNVEKVLEDIEKTMHVSMNHLIGIEFQEDTISPLAQEIFKEYFQLMNTISAQVITHRKIGIHRMVQILQDISFNLENELCRECRKMSTDSRTLYEENSILGKAIVDEMMKTIKMPTTEVGFFHSALMLLKVDDLIVKTKSKYIGFDEFTESTPSPTQVEEEKSYEESIIELVKILFEKLKNNDNARLFTSESKLFIDITHYVAEKFITELKLDAKSYEELKTTSVDLVGPELLKAMLEVIGMYANERSSWFKTKARLLGSESSIESMADNFLSRYHKTQSSLPKIFDTTIGDDGFITYKITCDQNGSDESFQELVYLLFNIKVDYSDCRIERDKRSIVLKSKNKVICFTFPGEENTALVILTDLDCGSVDI